MVTSGRIEEPIDSRKARPFPVHQIVTGLTAPRFRKRLFRDTGREEKGTSRSRCTSSPGRIQGRAGGDRDPRLRAATAGAQIMD
ncbi:MAG TPA: hypothetical protein PLU94_08020 [Methanoregulaceae archaeon]|nr:hypothetical protein [Methanoregulaceae archaeon]